MTKKNRSREIKTEKSEQKRRQWDVKGECSMSQKAENLLNLALDATAEEREKSLELDVGYNPIDREWDLIVRYSGNLDAVRALGAAVTELSNGYAIVTIGEDRIDQLVLLPQIEYVEKPKRLFFQVANGRRVSCINAVTRPPFSLSGDGVIVAILDSGIDYSNRDFRNEDGTTRIMALWDQTIAGSPPEGYLIGTEYPAQQINEALQKEREDQRRAVVPSQDTSGHGTSVAGIAAGNGAASPGAQFAGMAPKSPLLVVKLGSPRKEGFPRTTELMQGLDYVVRKAQQAGMPVAVNISFGNTYGSHDGSSLLERFIDDIADNWKNVICIGSGNEGTSAGHVSGRLEADSVQQIQLAVQEREPTVSIQVWKYYEDEVRISLISPSGVQVGSFEQRLGSQRFLLGQTEILLYYGEPSPYSTRQEVYIDLLPRQSYIDSGIWNIVLESGTVTTGAYEMWLPSQSALNVGTAFLKPSSELTQTIPSTAGRAVTVGAYNALDFSYADFSGRGPRIDNPVLQSNISKPDLAAPGVNITAPVAGGGYGEVTGTSFATPFVTGSAALLMEWGIVQGNDRYLYGEKVKAYLRSGAKQLPGFTEYPNSNVGWGALCVKDSLPV
ncbi:Subtilase family protein [Hespellia stercorisuis DSM 15480]|uniref:Subtilase family protein n=2 Tax=Hespellia stercorisuis TaxID=180311 RepID=A0A1M6M9I0_9FIRM|nr:Subtilase family protein [Hespellia stercorisuis DSM 15480]